MATSSLPEWPAALPRPATVLVGREREIAASTALLAPGGEAHLLTVTGPGGVGKTSVALGIAVELAPRFPDGTVFVDLTPLRDPALVPSAVAQALGVQEAGDEALARRLGRVIGERTMLLVLDNCEQVVAAVAELVAELLTGCLNLAVLGTSRVRLNLTREQVVPLAPLALPAAAEHAPKALLAAPAVALFVERARRVRPDFALTAENATTVAAICARLDGLPLAIELAAARVAVLPPDALLARLEHRLPLLTGGPRDAPTRQRTIRDAIAWSHDLLTPGEQKLFRRLSVFAGGFTLEAAEVVADQGSPTVGHAVHVATASPATFDTLASVVDKSLVQRAAETPSGENREPRFRMLETVREFGLERLAASGEEEAARDRHAVHFLAVARRAAPRQLGGSPVGWLDRLAADHDNLRAALDRLCRAESSEDCLRLTAYCAWFWARRGHLEEGRKRLLRALALAGPEPTAAKGRLLRYLTEFAVDAGDLRAAIDYAREGMAVAEAIGHPRLRAFTLHALAKTEDALGHWDAAADRYREELPIWRGFGESLPVAMVLLSLGRVVSAQGDQAQARAIVEEAESIFRDVGDPTWLHSCGAYLGLIALAEGQIAEAACRYRASLRGHAEAAEAMYLIVPLVGLAATAIEGGRPDCAAHLLGAADAQLRRTGATLVILNRLLYERAEAAARAALGEDAYAAEHAVGREVDRDGWFRAADLVVAVVEERAGRVSVAALPGPTRRETEILRLVGAGRTNREIADTLFISVPTVKRHLTTVFAKLGVASRAAAAEAARIRGLS